MDNNQFNLIVNLFYELARAANEGKGNHSGLQQKLNFILRQLPRRTDEERYYILQAMAEMFVEYFKSAGE